MSISSYWPTIWNYYGKMGFTLAMHCWSLINKCGLLYCGLLLTSLHMVCYLHGAHMGSWHAHIAWATWSPIDFSTQVRQLGLIAITDNFCPATNLEDKKITSLWVESKKMVLCQRCMVQKLMLISIASLKIIMFSSLKANKDYMGLAKHILGIAKLE